MLSIFRYLLHGEEKFRPGHPVQLLLFFFNNCRQGHAYNLIEEFESFLSTLSFPNKLKTQIKNLCQNKHAVINSTGSSNSSSSNSSSSSDGGGEGKYIPYPNLVAAQSAFASLLQTTSTDTSDNNNNNNLVPHLYIIVHYLKILIALKNKDESNAIREEVLKYYALGLQWMEQERRKNIGEEIVKVEEEEEEVEKVEEKKDPQQQKEPEEKEQKNEQINTNEPTRNQKKNNNNTTTKKPTDHKEKMHWQMLWMRWRALYTFYIGHVYFVHNETKTAFTWFQNAAGQYPIDRPLKIQGACVDAMTGKYENGYNSFITVIKSMDQNIAERIAFHKQNNTKQSLNKNSPKKSHKRSKYSRNSRHLSQNDNTLASNSIFSTDDTAYENVVDLLSEDQTEPFVAFKFPFQYPYEHCNVQEKKFISYKLVAHIGCCAILLLDRSYRWTNWWPNIEVWFKEGWRAYLSALKKSVIEKKTSEEKWDLMRQHIREAVRVEPASVILKYVASYVYYQCGNIEISQKYYDQFVKSLKKSNKKMKNDKLIGNDYEIDMSHFKWSPQQATDWKTRLEVTINMLISMALIALFYYFTGFYPHIGQTKGEQLIVLMFLMISFLLVGPSIGLLCVAIALPTTRVGNKVEELHFGYFAIKLAGTLVAMYVSRQVWE